MFNVSTPSPNQPKPSSHENSDVSQMYPDSASTKLSAPSHSPDSPPSELSTRFDSVPIPSSSNLLAIPSSSVPIHPAQTARERKFEALLGASHVDAPALRKICWNGVPARYRPLVWQLLLGYAPLVRERRLSTLQSKRTMYWQAAHRFFTNVESSDRNAYEQEIHHQIAIDVPRTHPGIPLYHVPLMQTRLNRVLYVWAIRHPASGYVQGIADLLTPFISVFLSPYGPPQDCDSVAKCDAWLNTLPNNALDDVEADSYYCMTLLVDHVQDNYTTDQPGIQNMLFKLSELVWTIDQPLAQHLDDIGVPYTQFAFRWMNCLLMREIHLNVRPNETESVTHVVDRQSRVGFVH